MSENAADYAASVWAELAQSSGGVSEITRSACTGVIEALHEFEVPSAAAAQLIGARIQEALVQFGVGMETFQLIAKVIDVCGDVIDESASKARVMDALMHMKHGMAVLYDDLARLAPTAGVDFVPRDETQRELAEAKTELSSWIADRASYGYAEETGQE